MTRQPLHRSRVQYRPLLDHFTLDLAVLEKDGYLKDGRLLADKLPKEEMLVV